MAKRMIVATIVLSAGLCASVARAQAPFPPDPQPQPKPTQPAQPPAQQQWPPINDASAKDAAAKPASDDASGTYAYLKVYRPNRFNGKLLAPSVYVDDTQVARVGTGRRFTAHLTPGPHTIHSDDKSSAITIDAKAGQEYYVRVDEGMGLWKGHGKLTLIMADQGKPEYALEKPIEPDRRYAVGMLEKEAEPDQDAAKKN